MKVVLVLALALAVANAAFTGSLVQQTKPLLNQARANMQMSVARSVRARSSAEAAFQTSFIQGLMDQATAIMEQIQAAVATGQSIAENVIADLQNAFAELQSMGSSAFSSAQEMLSNFLGGLWGSIFGRNKRASIDITPEMQGLMQMVLSNPTFVNSFRSEPMYQCLKSKDITVDHAHLQALNQANQLNAGLLNKPEVSECLLLVGGLQAVLQGPTSTFVQGLVTQLGIRPLVHQVLNNLLGPELTAQVLSLLSSRHRGVWDSLSNLWGTITEGAGNAWESISNGVSNGWNSFVETVANIVDAVTTGAVSQFQQVQMIAQQFVAGGVDYVQQLGLQGAQQLIALITPYASDLGTLYTQIVEQVTAVYGNLLTIGA